MAAPPSYLDECVDHALVERLRHRGFSVTSALEEDQANSGADDADQLLFASARNLVLVSFNERHFRVLSADYRRRGQSHGGIIIVPAGPSCERLTIRLALMLDWLGTMADHRPQIFKWGHLQALLEQGYRLPGYTEDEVRLALAR